MSDAIPHDCGDGSCKDCAMARALDRAMETIKQNADIIQHLRAQLATRKNDVEEGIDDTGGFQHLETSIVEAFYRAGKTIECAHAVFPARSKSTGKWFPIVLFFDEDKKQFSYAFRLDDQRQTVSLMGLLLGCDKYCEKMNAQ